MMEKYINYVEKFNKLDIEDKKKIIIDNFNELYNVLYTYNNKLDISKDLLPVYQNYSTDEEFLNLLFTYIISFKEENANLIKYITENK